MSVTTIAPISSLAPVSGLAPVSAVTIYGSWLALGNSVQRFKAFNFFTRQRLADKFLNAVQVICLVGANQGVSVARRACTTGAADSVDIVFGDVG